MWKRERRLSTENEGEYVEDLQFKKSVKGLG